MSKTFENSMPWPSGQAAKSNSSKTTETTSGGKESVPWVVVAENLNPGEAAIIKGLLDSENIPTLVQQEAVGTVLALTVGPLGSARVLVPEPLAQQALDILDETYDTDEPANAEG